MKKFQISNFKFQVTNNKPPRPSGTPPFKRRGIGATVLLFCSSALLLFCFSAFSVSAQSLLDVYKKGVVKLVPDTEYAKDNNWGKVFESYYDTLYHTAMGDRKSIVLTPTGSVVVSHRYRNFYTLFDANGKFVREFGIKDKAGKPIKEPEAMVGVMNNNLFTGLDKMGKMNCYDLNGNYVKTLALNYSAKEIIPLSNNKIAVVGWSIWKNKSRDFVAIVDYETNEQKIIWYHFSPTNNPMVSINEKGVSLETSGNITATVDFISPSIAFVRDLLVVALPHNGEILFYDINGKLKKKDKVSWEQKYLSVEEQKKMEKKAIEKFDLEERKKMMALGASKENIDAWLGKMKENMNRITTPKPLPMFSNILKDSDGNLLFFETPETEGGNKFNVWVYQNGGQFVCQSSFVCDDYNLVITPSKMVFHKGYIYALQTLKNAKGNPLRLVRFKITN